MIFQHFEMDSANTIFISLSCNHCTRGKEKMFWDLGIGIAYKTIHSHKKFIRKSKRQNKEFQIFRNISNKL